MHRGRLLLGLALTAMMALSYYGARLEGPVAGAVGHPGLSPEQDVALGLQLAPAMAERLGGLDPDAFVQKKVQGIGDRLAAESQAATSAYRFRFLVLADTRTVAAFALPGGPIFVTRALYSRLRNDAELAGVLGHEIAHVVERHVGAALASSGLGDLGSSLEAATGGPADSVARFRRLAFPAVDELAADTLAVRLMANAGYDPRALVAAMDRAAKLDPGATPPEFASAHRDPGNRAARITQTIAEAFPSGLDDDLTTGDALQARADARAF